MHSNIAITKKMIEYAKLHKIAVPKVSLTSPVWGNGKRTLAWRVSGSLHERGKHVPQSAQKTPQLDAWFFPPTPGQKAIAIAARELGVKETPYASNDGPRVHVYQSSTGAYRAPWCASFVTWCYQQAGVKLPPFNHAYVPDWHRHQNDGLLDAVPKTSLKPGDAVCLWNDGHIELFQKWIIKGVLAQCIGGNTSAVGKNNNGGMVAQTKRYTYEMSACIRVTKFA